ncbi:coiled-coil domain-containing protein 159 isoform X2 [Cavia porcellus]|uniref:coiled-coil domain-containing protein 159 isoform X2 n=1 Tax=Cavia porcellus TaxID=10141 RepID=UPI000C87B56A|nr:coiled-coil domain-containing protein 159 isoform X2 [Cavia porcellus]
MSATPLSVTAFRRVCVFLKRWHPNEIKFQRHGWRLASRSLMGEYKENSPGRGGRRIHDREPSRRETGYSDPLLAGLPRDPYYSLPCRPCPPSPSTADHRTSDKYWDKALDFTTHWSRSPEPDCEAATCSEHGVSSRDWKSEWGPGPQAHVAAPFAKPELKKEARQDRDILKWDCDLAKKPSDTSCPTIKVKCTTISPESQKLLRCELESLKSQLQAQTKAFEFLNHSVTMLEKESCLQQIKIQQLEEVLNPMARQGDKEGHKWDTEQSRQELYGALAQGLRGLQRTLRDSEELQRSRTTHCLQLLANEIRDSKKFLWEELELVREEVTFIYQKLQAQEKEIAENLSNIQKVQRTQMKCRKVLTKMKQQQGYDPCSGPDDEEVLPGNKGWKDDLQKELSDIWSAVHGLQNSIDGLVMSSEAPHRVSGLRGNRGHRCLSPGHPSWEPDSHWDPSPFGKSHSFPSV